MAARSVAIFYFNMWVYDVYYVPKYVGAGDRSYTYVYVGV